MNEEISLLIKNFEAISNPNQEIRGPANEMISQLISENPLKFLYVSSQVIFIDGLPSLIYSMALTLMGHTLAPTLKTPIELISKIFLDPSNAEARKLTKEASFRGLMFQDQVIRQQASNCINLILAIEKDQWSELIPSLFEVATSGKYSNEAHLGAIYCFRNIISGNIPFSFIQTFVAHFYNLIIQILSSDQIAIENIFDECFQCYMVILNRLESENMINDEIVTKCFQLIGKSIEKYGLAKTNYYFTALFSVLKGVYMTTITRYIEDYISLSLKVLQEGSFNQQIDVIYRWEAIAKFEGKQPVNQGIIRAVSEHFFPIFLRVISLSFQNLDSLDSLDFLCVNEAADELSDSSRAIYACCRCLSEFYSNSPDKIFSLVAENFAKSTQTNLSDLSIALVTLISIIKKNPENQALVNFIFENSFKEKIFSLIMNDNLLVSALALMVILKSVKKMEAYIRNDEDVAFLFSRLKECSDKNGVLAYYCCYIIFRFFNSINSRINRGLCTCDTSLISDNFELILNTLNYYLSHNNSPRNMKSSFAAFNAFIIIIPKSSISCLYEFQENFFKKTLEKTLTSPMEYSTEVLFILQSSMINFMESIAYKLGKEGMAIEKVDEVIRLLFVLTKVPNTPVYEETLRAFCSIIINIKEGFSPYINELMNLILLMLNTGNGNIINQAILTISDLFRSLNQLMKDYVEPVFKILLSIIYSGNANRDLILSIISTLTDVVKNIENVNSDTKIEFFNVTMKLARTIAPNPSNKKEVAFINNFFTTIFYAFAVLVESAVGDQSFEFLNYDQHFLPLITIFNRVNLFDEFSLFSFTSFVWSLAIFFGHTIQIKINSTKITSILKKAINFGYPQLEMKASETLFYIQNRI